MLTIYVCAKYLVYFLYKKQLFRIQLALRNNFIFSLTFYNEKIETRPNRLIKGVY